MVHVLQNQKGWTSHAVSFTGFRKNDLAEIDNIRMIHLLKQRYLLI